MATKKKKPKPGDLIRQKNPSSDDYRYGTVLTVARPMRDDPEWTDHWVFWYDGGEETIEWCGNLDLVSDE